MRKTYHLSLTCPPKPWRRWITYHLKRGVTLIEMLLYMGIFSIFLVVLTDIFVSILSVRSESEASSTIEKDGRYLLSRLSYDISRADSISNPTAIGQTDNLLRLVIGPVNYTYSTLGSNMTLLDNQGLNFLNGSETSISNIQFTRIGNTSVVGTKDNIKLQFTLTSKTQRNSGPETKTFTTTIGRR